MDWVQKAQCKRLPIVKRRSSGTHLDGSNLIDVGLDGKGELEHVLATLNTGSV